jgi:hypothetical protein
MKLLILVTLCLSVITCENTTGQYRHDPVHHDKPTELEFLDLD